MAAWLEALDGARAEYWKRNGHDIQKVSDLLAGPHPVLKQLPRAQPYLEGFEWVLDPETHEIVSSFYKIRYRLHETETDRQRRQRGKQQAEGAAREGA